MGQELIIFNDYQWNEGYIRNGSISNEQLINRQLQTDKDYSLDNEILNRDEEFTNIIFNNEKTDSFLIEIEKQQYQSKIDDYFLQLKSYCF